ncbi:MAG: peptidyl-prolyl cis-trans isomerase [Desulfovibrio sp.]|nr:peptidyl-prolyl cis-trans isomerase [Desulfovibrio sp.]
MRRIICVLCLAIAFAAMACLCGQARAASPAPVVKLETSMGEILIQLDPQKAPISTDNFLQYVKSGHYNGTVFHRVIKDFMIQGGGLTADLKEKKAHAPIRNEANNGLRNQKYTIAMARTSDPHSATAQFFINTRDNAFLDYKGQTPQGWGYAVFGKVISGKKVVDMIEKVATTKKGHYDDVPVSPVIIKKASVVQQ